MAIASEILSPTSSPAVLLRGHARLVERVLAGAVPVPQRWVTPLFVAQAETIRLQLRPIRSVGTLVASYGREAWLRGRHGTQPPGRADRLDAPLELAYAIRLLELDTGATLAPWTRLVRMAAEARHRGPAGS